MNSAYWLNTLYWITSRAAGITAMVLASASVGMGLAMSRGLAKWGGSDRRNIHQTLSLAAMAAIAIHGLTLLGDDYFHASLLGLTVPFVLSYEPLATSIGIIAGWGLIILGLSYYARRWIGHQRWRMLHRFTVLAWLGGLIHTFAEGTDAGQLWLIALVAVTAAPALWLFLTHLGERRSRPVVAA